MTNKEQLELIAQARELCEKKIEEIQGRLATGIAFDFGHLSKHLREVLNSWTTHLAEMDEHKAIEHCKNPLCHGPVCSKCGSKETLQVSYPCNDLLTKAKRLLGVE